MILVSDPRLVFVLSPWQNAFFAEIAEVLVNELIALGVAALVVNEPGRHLVRDDDVFVLLPPHEYTNLEGPGFIEDPVVAARTVGLSAEQPHQRFFDANAAVGAQLGAVLDFSPLAVAAFRAGGINAQHLRFGYTSRWDRYAPGNLHLGPPRVLYMGNKRERRLRVLAAAAEGLARHGAELLVSDNDAPNRATGPTFVAGSDKRDLLATTRLLVNIHQSDERYFEWLRFAEAAHCGTPVLTEVSGHSEPFVDGVHYESFEAPEFARRLTELVDDDARLSVVARAAYERLREIPMSATLPVLVEVATERLTVPAPAKLPTRTRTTDIGATRVDAVVTARPVGQRRRLWRRHPPSSVLVVAEEADALVEVLGVEFESVRAIDSNWLGRALRAQCDVSTVVMAPPRTRPFHDSFRELVGRYRTAVEDRDVALAVGVIAGVSVDGQPTLEGIWPWETWRLTAGQHLGRLLLVRADVVRAAANFLEHPAVAGQPHVGIQAWVASAGMRGVHLSRPVAAVEGTTLDPTQALDRATAAWQRGVLGAEARA
jgi:hypothetical protein